jgi:signal transduction histidine kinase
MRFQAKLYIGLTVGGGAWAIYRAISGWHSDDLPRFLCNLALCVLASGFKLNLPGLRGTMSVNFLFILIGMSQMSLGETMALGCAGTVAQCIWKAKSPVKAIRLLFSVSSMAIAVISCYVFCGILPLKSTPSLLLAASLVFFLMNTMPVAAVVALTEGRRLAQTWRDCYFWSFPFYVVGASIAWLLCLVSHNSNWLSSLLVMPILFFVYHSYRVYLGRLEDEKRHGAQLAEAQERLMTLSRQAGMAEIATGVLHNVGNVLNSVNISASLVAGKVRESRVDKLVSLIHMLEQHSGDLPEFLAKDPKGQRVLPYLAKLGDHFQSERDGLLAELESLSSQVDHIKRIVVTQQSYAKVSGLVEDVCLSDMVEDALRILEPGLVRHKIKVERDFEILPTIVAEKHAILQILLNVLRNAKQALKQADSEGGRVIRVHIRRLGESRISLAVRDNGVGLAPENLTRIFAHGFTTRIDGHGFGLHSCALAASQMGGSLRAESDGPGRGATFVLELPLKTADDSEKRAARPSPDLAKTGLMVVQQA